MYRLALLSDIHGNLPALEAVLADLDAQSPDAVWVLGDMINGCPWSSEVTDCLADRGWPMLQGNHDDAVLQLGTPRMEPRYGDRVRYGMLWWTRSRLTAGHVALLSGLEREVTLEPAGLAPVFLTHGLPGNFFAGVRPDSPEDWVERRLRGVEANVVASGHTHVAMARRFGRWNVVNSGSVGAPYDGDMRAGYVMLHGSSAGWRAEIRRIEYDLEQVERAFRQSGLAEAGNVLGEYFLRGVLTAQPWASDFAWWLREQPVELIDNLGLAKAAYDAGHGPGRWAFPYLNRV